MPMTNWTRWNKIKFEAMRIHFLSDLFVALAVVVDEAPYYSGSGRGFRVIRELTCKQCESEKLTKDSRDSYIIYSLWRVTL